ncbi:Segregation/condensation protein A OS=Streptomyces fumanus OX=67302 GN=GCM10018772_45320 PE=4 SV=1 [Streptomyces fumanus]
MVVAATVSWRPADPPPVAGEADLAQIVARPRAALGQAARRDPRRAATRARGYHVPRSGAAPAELLVEVVISIGAEGFARLAVKAMQPRPRPQVYVDHIHAPLVSVREQAGSWSPGCGSGRGRLPGAGAGHRRHPDRRRRFLALLELYREKAVALEQETALGELLVRWTGGGRGDRPCGDRRVRPAG